MGRILFITDLLPFPPTSGAKITIHRHMVGLRRRHEVSLLYIPWAEKPQDLEWIDENRQLVDSFWRVPVGPRDRVARSAWLYARGREPVSLPRGLDMTACEDAVGGRHFDAVICTSFRTCLLLPQVERCLSPLSPHCTVAAINDALGLTIRDWGRRALLPRMGWRARVSQGSQYLRLAGVVKWEREWLDRFDHVLVQTLRDKAWLRAISTSEQSRQVHVCGNCPAPDLFSLPERRVGKVVRFVGRLDRPHDAAFVSGVLDQVWPRVLARHSDAEFRILGLPGSKRLMQRIASTAGVTHAEFVQDLHDVYRDASILLFHRQARVGMISRVLEAMASGVVVVGDAGAFNGITGFKDRRHGVVCGLSGMAETVNGLFGAPGEIIRVGGQARELMRSRFQWEDRIRLIETVLGIKDGSQVRAPSVLTGSEQDSPAVT